MLSFFFASDPLVFSLLINDVILLLNCLALVLYLYIHILSEKLLYPLKHYLDLYRSDTVLKVTRSLYCFTTSICHGVVNYFPRLWGMGRLLFYDIDEGYYFILMVCHRRKINYARGIFMNADEA